MLFRSRILLGKSLSLVPLEPRLPLKRQRNPHLLLPQGPSLGQEDHPATPSTLPLLTSRPRVDRDPNRRRWMLLHPRVQVSLSSNPLFPWAPKRELTDNSHLSLPPPRVSGSALLADLKL